MTLSSPLAPERVNLRDIARDAIKAAQPAATAKGVRFTFDCSELHARSGGPFSPS